MYIGIGKSTATRELSWRQLSSQVATEFVFMTNSSAAIDNQVDIMTTFGIQ